VPDSLDTIAAACALGVDLVEFDVRLNSVGAFVVGHDGASTLTLAEVLDVVAGRVRAHVDLKVAAREVELADLCTEVLGQGNFVITTRHDGSIRRLRTVRPDVVVGLSIGRAPVRIGPVVFWWLRWSELFPWRRLRRCGANLVAPHHQLARLGVLAGAARRGLPVLVWTLNTDPLIRAAQRDDRIWAYTTDYPRRALRLATESATESATDSGG
jgi:glycerophosphoryl diester phosphodiesterase